MSRSCQRAVVAAAAALFLFAGPVGGGAGRPRALVQVSGTRPLAGCTADDVAAQSGDNVLHSEVVPWIASSNVDRSGDGVPDLIAAYQQDRWSNGGARGNFASVLHGGVWRQVGIPGVS